MLSVFVLALRSVSHVCRPAQSRCAGNSNWNAGQRPVCSLQRAHRTSLGFAHPLARNARPNWAGRPVCPFFAAFGLRPPRPLGLGESPSQLRRSGNPFLPSRWTRSGGLRFARFAHSLRLQLPPCASLRSSLNFTSR